MAEVQTEQVLQVRQDRARVPQTAHGVQLVPRQVQVPDPVHCQGGRPLSPGAQQGGVDPWGVDPWGDKTFSHREKITEESTSGTGLTIQVHICTGPV